jgi:Kef-type K+ transport system membrane component KefB
MPHSQGVALLVISLAAALIPLAATRVGAPAMVLEILFGVFLGQVGFQGMEAGGWLPFLAHLGFLMLMFMAGLEIDFSVLRAGSPGCLSVYVAVFLLTVGLSYILARGIGYGLFLALVLSTTSLGLVVPALRDLGISKTELGQSILVTATLSDFLTLLCLTCLLLYHDLGAGLHLAKPLLVFAAFMAALWGIRSWAWWNPALALRLLGTSDPTELGVRAAMALLFVFVGVSELLKIESILGAFLGGCVLSAVFPNRGLLEEKLAGFSYGFLIPVFFIHVGIQCSPAAFLQPAVLLFTAELLFIAGAVKLIPSLLFTLRGLSLRESLMAGVLLSSRLSLIVAAAAIGVERGLLPAEHEPSIVCLALLSVMICPVAFKRMAKSRAGTS